MNAPQKVTALLVLAGLPLVLLFMQAMNYRGPGLVVLIGTAGACGVLYAMRPRTKNAQAELICVSEDIPQRDST